MLHRPSDQERRLIYEEEKARKQNTGTKCGSNSLLPERKVQGTAKKSVAGTSGTIGLRCVCVCVCHTHAWCPQIPKESIDWTPITEVTVMSHLWVQRTKH